MKAQGIDTWNIHWRGLQQKPGDLGRWYHRLALCNGERMSEMVNFAEASIDRAAIGTCWRRTWTTAATFANMPVGTPHSFKKESEKDKIERLAAAPSPVIEIRLPGH